MKAIRQRCPLCGRLEPAPKKVKVQPVNYASMIFHEPFQAMRDPSYALGEFDNSWATMRYGHSPYDRPENEIGKLGTLEAYQREMAETEEVEELEPVAA